jgi:hypothetical protein
VPAEYSGVRLHAAAGYVTSPTSTKAETMLFASNAAMASPLHSWHESIQSQLGSKSQTPQFGGPDRQSYILS